MAIVNFQEKLLFYTKRKSVLTTRITDIQSQILTVTRREATNQTNYNKKCQQAYYDPDYGHGTDEYGTVMEAIQSEHEREQASLTAWETQLELEKDTLDAQLAEITQFEQSWQNLLKNNIQKDFSYGGGGK